MSLYCNRCHGVGEEYMPPLPFIPCKRCAGDGFEIKTLVKVRNLSDVDKQELIDKRNATLAQDKILYNNPWYYLAEAIKMSNKIGWKTIGHYIMLNNKKDKLEYDDSMNIDSLFWQSVIKARFYD